MIRRSVIVVTVVIVLFSLFSLNSCARRRVVKEEGIAKEETKLPGGEGVVEDELAEARRKVEDMRKKPGIKISTVYFDFDDFSLSENAKETLIENAAWLMNNPQKNIVIEGHCDERGTAEYNLALGERRAGSAKKYLVNLGVGTDQLSTISYGKERPADLGHTEDAWARNRRAEFVIR